MIPLLALALLLGGPRPTCVAPDGAMISLELAISEEERAQGLMFRDELSPDHGMLFLFGREDHFPFWMKNTYINLDIIWLSAAGDVVEVHKNALPCRADPCPSYVPSKRSSAVLEIAAGAADRHGIRPGTKLRFANVPSFPLGNGAS